MHQALVDVFQKLNLEPGRYHVHVNGYDVEIQVAKRSAGEPVVAARYDESDVMLEPWVELPRPKPIGTIMAYPAPPRPPDIPEHLAKHFADTYSRIGLPQPYETET